MANLLAVILVLFSCLYHVRNSTSRFVSIFCCLGGRSTRQRHGILRGTYWGGDRVGDRSTCSLSYRRVSLPRERSNRVFKSGGLPLPPAATFSHLRLVQRTGFRVLRRARERGEGTGAARARRDLPDGVFRSPQICSAAERRVPRGCATLFGQRGSHRRGPQGSSITSHRRSGGRGAAVWFHFLCVCVCVLWMRCLSVLIDFDFLCSWCLFLLSLGEWLVLHFLRPFFSSFFCCIWNLFDQSNLRISLSSCCDSRWFFPPTSWSLTDGYMKWIPLSGYRYHAALSRLRASGRAFSVRPFPLYRRFHCS